MLKITTPDFCIFEIEYVLSVIFSEWFDINYEVFFSDIDCIEISFAEKKIVFNACFFKNASDAWLDKSSMPVLPLSKYNFKDLESKLRSEIHINACNLLVLYGDPKIEISDNIIDCGIDIFGSIFFMISRYEEIVVKERDVHDRFFANSSVAYQEGFLFRPIVNEYLELLFALLKFLWPNLERKEHKFTVCPTHDVDVPFYYLYLSFTTILRRMLGDIIKRRSLRKFFNTYKTWKNVNKRNLNYDPVYTFDFIMRESEKHNLKSAFYFLPSSSPEMEIKYPVTITEIKTLLEEIDRRGHEIGIHGFYGTYLDKKAFNDDVVLLQNTCKCLGIQQNIRGGRQHYLQWQNPDTFNVWESAGMEYDSTLSFADMPGFRCGTCYEYSVYDCVQRKKLKLKERPLIAMECSIIAERYMNLGLTNQALEVFKKLKDQCRFYNGTFVILFHNTELITVQQKRFYMDVLDC